jgi:hypothetical protein
VSAAPRTICVLAKAPEPGRVKSRLAKHIGDVAAARVAATLLADTWRWVSTRPNLSPALALEGDASLLPPLEPAPRIWRQGEGDLGARIEDALARGLGENPRGALAAGADAVAPPNGVLEEALRLLDEGAAVLGPTDDGGYYLVGLPAPFDAGLLAGLPWSSPDTFEATRMRLRSRGLRVETVEPWFDVDRLEDLQRLAAALGGPGPTSTRAPATAALLRALPLPGRGS